MLNKQGLIDYLQTSGKDKSWEELASQFGYSPEGARGAWFEHRKSQHIIKPRVNTLNIQVTDTPEIRKLVEEYVSETKVTSFEEDLKSGEAQMQVASESEIKSLDDLVSKTNIDLTKWNIIKWVQNFWANKYQVKVWLEPKTANKAAYFQEKFVEFLSTYKPKEVRDITRYDNLHNNLLKTDSILIINKQDSHLNKYDVGGENDINVRFKSFENAVDKVVIKASLSNNLSAIGYIIGSDQFNSEFTGTTTKGTPQQNILDYHKSFQAICDHEVSIIEKLAANTEELHVMFLGGNHDEYVGWHMAKWLEAYFRKEDNIIIDSSEEYTKYVQFGNTAMMFNHGDVIKPEKLASIFPIGAKEMWSSCEHHLVFTGDKHHLLAKDFNGIQFYQLPALSTAKSLWDKKQGFVSKSELTCFIVSQNDGLSEIYKERIK